MDSRASGSKASEARDEGNRMHAMIHAAGTLMNRDISTQEDARESDEEPADFGNM